MHEVKAEPGMMRVIHSPAAAEWYAAGGMAKPTVNFAEGRIFFGSKSDAMRFKLAWKGVSGGY